MGWFRHYEADQVEIPGLSSPAKFAYRLALKIWAKGWWGPLVERSDLNELAHEALVAMWTESLSQTELPSNPSSHYGRIAVNAIARFLREDFGSWGAKTLRIVQFPEGRRGEWILGQDTSLEPRLIARDLYRRAKQTLRAERNQTRGKQKAKLLDLFLQGYFDSEVAERCDWIKTRRAAGKATSLTIQLLRVSLGGDLGAPISIRMNVRQRRREAIDPREKSRLKYLGKAERLNTQKRLATLEAQLSSLTKPSRPSKARARLRSLQERIERSRNALALCPDLAEQFTRLEQRVEQTKVHWSAQA